MIRIALAALILISAANLASAGEPRSDILVTADWLAERIGGPSLVVLQVAEVRPEYSCGHIPGAIYLWPGWFEKDGPVRSVELFSVAHMDSVLESLGVSNSSEIVLCHTYSTLSAACVARMWVVLDFLGMGDRTKILDGGFEAWNLQGKPVTKDVPLRTRGTFTPRIKKDIFVDMEFVKANMSNPDVKVIDNRRTRDFKGDIKGVIRTGHIPGAISLPYSSIIDETLCYFPVETLRARFADAGIEPGDRIIAYCYKGRAACMTYIAAKMLGYDAYVYDGSFEDWREREDLQLEVSAAGN